MFGLLLIPLRPEIVQRMGTSLCWALAILIVVLLSSQVTVREGHYNRPDAAKLQIAELLKALNSYRSDVGRFPTEEQGLQTLRTDPGIPEWRGPYIQKDIPVDPWGHPYSVTDGHPQLFSGGIDGHSPIPHPSPR